MKKLTRTLALVLSLMLALTCCAFAEESLDSTMYTLSIFDPVLYYNQEPMIDLTGATLDLNATLSDSGAVGLLVNLFAGEELDYATGATLQLDANGVSGLLDGMSNVYSADVASLTGVDPYEVLSELGLRDILNDIDLSMLEGIEFTPEMRVMLASELFSTIAGEPQGDVYPLSISAEEGRALLEALGELIEQIDADTAEEYKDMLEASPTVTILLEGSMTYDGTSIDVTATGKLTDEEDSLPFTLSYSDDTSAVSVDLKLIDEFDDTLFALSGSSSAEATADGRSAVDALFTLEADGEAMHITYTATPDAESEEIDYTLAVDLPDEDLSVEFYVQTGFNPEGVGFSVSVSAVEDDYCYGCGLQYMGESNEGDDGIPYHTGYLYLYAQEEDEQYALDLGLMMQKQDVDSASWMLASEDAIDLYTMDEDQLESVMSEAMTVLQDALPVLTAGVPGLSALMEEMA